MEVTAIIASLLLRLGDHDMATAAEEPGEKRSERKPWKRAVHTEPRRPVLPPPTHS